MNQLFTIIASALKLSSSEIDLCTAMKSTAAWDSLAHMDLVISIEEHYQITLDGDQIADMTSVAAIVEQLQQRGLLRNET
jgi:acyl carrier protein